MWWKPWTWKYNSYGYDGGYGGGYGGGYSPDYTYKGYGDYGYPCGSYYPKGVFWKPWTWKFYKYAKTGYYTGDCYGNQFQKVSKHDEKCAKKVDEVDLNLAEYNGRVAINTDTTTARYGTGHDTIDLNTMAMVQIGRAHV